MRIAYVSAGAAGMLCGSCLHDNTLAAAIRRQGHDIVLLPTYTPIRTDETDVSTGRPFYGAVNIYLQTRSALFRRTPRLVDRVLDHPALLRLASRLAGATSAADLGRLTIAVLEGEEGPQVKELRRLADWLAGSFRPEIVHLTNSMFLGLAAPLGRELGVPVVCSLQGEDLFLEGLAEPWRSRALGLMRRKARDAQVFIATSLDYAERMRLLLDLDPARVRVVRLGVSLEGHAPAAEPRPAGSPFVIGYLARVCPEKGLHLLAEAFRRLASEKGGEMLRLRAAGYLGPADRRWYEDLVRRIASWGLADRFEYLGEVDRAGKLRFLAGLDLFCVPTVYRESKGLPVLEAMASGVAVAQPRHGSFPEMIEATGGGILFEPGSVEGLAAAIRTLRDDPEGRRLMGERGREAVRRLHSDDVMAIETLKVYFAAVSERARG